MPRLLDVADQVEQRAAMSIPIVLRSVLQVRHDDRPPPLGQKQQGKTGGDQRIGLDQHLSRPRPRHSCS